MPLTARIAGLAAIVATAVACALAPGAGASPNGSSAPREQVHVNPSTGFVTTAPTADGTIEVNPSTGFASVAQHPASKPIAASRPIEPTSSPVASDGFDWGSAGIGAAAGAGLVLALMLSLTTARVGGLARLRRAS